MGDYTIPTERVARVAVPTVVLTGGASFDWMGETAETIVAALPNGEHQTIEGATHDISGELLAPVLAAFFLG
jgi:hypothetical protein